MLCCSKTWLNWLYFYAIKSVFQVLRNSLLPLLTAFLRLIVFVLSIVYLFTFSSNVLNLVWLTFPIAEILTAAISVVLLKYIVSKKIAIIPDDQFADSLIITISKEHGTNAKCIGRLVSKKLGIAFYDKKLLLSEAKSIDLYDKRILNTEEDGYSLYLSLDANKNAIIAQSEIIKSLTNEKLFVVVGRCADYIFRNNKKLVRVFLHAPIKYRVAKVCEMYNDSAEDVLKNIKKSDEARNKYYTLVLNQNWSDKNNYDLYLDASKDEEKIVNEIV